MPHCRLWRLVAALCLTAVAHAAEYPIEITDWTGRGFAPDLVHYQLPRMPLDPAKLRLVDAQGRALPVQLTPHHEAGATLSFVTDLPADGTVRLALRDDGQGPVAGAAVTSKRTNLGLEMSNQLLGVRLPPAGVQTFEQPVPASTLPPPILAFRGPEGAWRGAAKIVHDRPVKRFAVVYGATGPVFAEVAYTLEYADGGSYEARVRVTDRVPFAEVSETYDLAAERNRHYWELDLAAGWEPDAAEHMSVAGQGFSPIRYPSLAKEEETRAGGPAVGADFPGGGGAPTRSIHHDSCWGARYVSYYGVHLAAEREAAEAAAEKQPATYPIAMVAPLHKGAWRRANSINVYVREGQVRVRFPMDVAPISWQNEPASDVSPFSCHEHDPTLPASVGRRTWGLVLAPPDRFVTGYGKKTTIGIGYSVRNLYGTVGLDRYKDFVLAWPDTKPTYPRVFNTPAGTEAYRQAVADAPDFPLRKQLEKYWWFTQDPQVAAKEIAEVDKWLRKNIDYHISSLSVHHHHATAAWGEPLGHAESLLSWPDLPAEQRRLIRGRLALLAYLLIEPDVTSAANSSHHGNPNMGVARLMDRSNVIALVPDHPMHDEWARYAAEFMAYKMGSFMAPEGGWFEYGASYHLHGYGKTARGIIGALADHVPNAEQLSHYHRQNLDYLLNLLSPYDSRYGSRTIPGSANSPVGQLPHWLQMMASVRDREFAANLHWAWHANGRMIGTGADSIQHFAAYRPEIPPREPELDSRLYPGYGVILRAHQGPHETALFLRSGYLWSHWNQDQGNVMLWSKGAVLLPSQPYGYGGPKDKAFPDKNFLRFGHPTNDLPHAWPDSNIVDSYFSDSVDYAWHRSSYPRWFIDPGYKKGFGQPRELVEGAAPQDGAFTWDRQVMFLKSPNPKGANYFVIRDSIGGEGRLPSWFNLSLPGQPDQVTTGPHTHVDTEWPTDLDLFFLGRRNLDFELRADALPLDVGSYNIPTDQARLSPYWRKGEGQPDLGARSIYQEFRGVREQRVALRLPGAPGQGLTWVLFPRAEGEPQPKVSLVPPGAVKVEHAERTDYVFLGTEPVTFMGDEAHFVGRAGAVRVPNQGPPTVVLAAAPGSVGYGAKRVGGNVPFARVLQGREDETFVATPEFAIAAPIVPATAQEVAPGLRRQQHGDMLRLRLDADQPVSREHAGIRLHARRAVVEVGGETVRFVAPDRQYVELSAKNVGVRGVGPFDLTFTPDSITGRVDGDVRTITCTWPEGITRPAYWQDGVRYYAGFADEHSIVRHPTQPCYSLAFGLSAGPHEVRLGEWTWPELPPSPPRQALGQP